MVTTAPNSLARDVLVRLQSDADALAKAEPFLAALALQVVPDGVPLVGLVARRLATLLQQAEIPRDHLQELLVTVASTSPQLEEGIASDLAALRSRDPACLSYLHALMNFKGFQALQAHRFAHALWTSGRPELAGWLSNRAALVLGPDIHPAARLGHGIMLDHGSGIVIGETAIVEDDVSILQGVTLGGTGKDLGDRHPIIRRGVMIGAGAKILGRVVIGVQSKVAAGSVVLKDVPPRCTVAGVPAQIVRIHAKDEVPAATMVQSI
jgi:serine O-acetyltransferase